MQAMKRFLIALFVLSASLTLSWGQERPAPGIYAIIGEEPFKMERQKGLGMSNSVDDESFIFEKQFIYKGASSSLEATGEFLLVCDPDVRNYLVTPFKYNIFTNNLSPKDLLIVPLEVKRNKRVYDCRKLHTTGKALDLLGDVEWLCMDFTCEELEPFIWSIKAKDLPAGEYALVFRYMPQYWEFDFNNIFGFTVK